MRLEEFIGRYFYKEALQDIYERELVENSEKQQKTVQENVPQGNVLVLPAEVVEALKKLMS